MEQRLLIKITRLEGLTSKEIHFKLLLLSGTEALSHSEMGYWRRQVFMGGEYVEGARRTARPPDFNYHRRIRELFGERPIASIRTLEEATGYTPSTVFFVLSEVLGFEFRHWR
jgi:hypothetical protein